MALQAFQLTSDQAEHFAGIARACVSREYPNHVMHLLNGDGDARPPRELHPAFYGCFDWHSAVHGHWTLVRLLRLFPDLSAADAIRDVLDRHLTRENLTRETDYLAAPGRAGFERPYGLAWLLQLAAELREWNDAAALRWFDALRPLEQAAVDQFTAWLQKLTHPIRSGEHSQTAFAMGLCLDWARTSGDTAFADLVRRRALDFYAGDVNGPLDYEPSGHDFLSPCLAEADLLRRVFNPADFAAWLGEFLPQLHTGMEMRLAPVGSTDRADGKLAHLDGLNLSRAWMLEGIASGLPKDDLREAKSARAAGKHAQAGLESVTDEHYAGAHWLASFAVYLTTRRGIASSIRESGTSACPVGTS